MGVVHDGKQRQYTETYGIARISDIVPQLLGGASPDCVGSKVAPSIVAVPLL